MPFQSEKQRRYLHANHPEIANRWEAKYGLGGIADLNDLPEYYIPKNHGGFIPAHEAGIYGLAEGGRTGFFSGTQPGHTPEGRSESQGGQFGSSYGPGRDRGYQDVHQTGAVSQTPGRTTTPTPDKGDGPINIHRDDTIEVIEEQKKTDEINRQNALRQMVLDQSEKTEKWEAAQQWNKPNKFMSFIRNAALAIIPGLLPAKLATAWNFGQGVFNYKQGKFDKYLPDKLKSDGEFAESITTVITEAGKTRQKKMDLYKDLPEGHPERIALQAELEIGKKTPDDVPDKDGVETSIKIENIEEVNDAKTQLQQKYQEMDEASRLSWQRQQEMQAKKEAYLRNFRQMYMSAQGGRVPSGYNTGGLSNLFRLKNV